VKHIYIIFFSFLLHASGYSQSITDSQSHRIAVFVPLYLDSVFDAHDNYRFNESFPKFINSGLEFYEGAQLALDTLRHEGAHLDIHIYDTRSSRNPLSEILQSPDFQNTELIIGHANSNESRLLAHLALQKHIPFINATLPNDGNINNNPEFVLLNSTLKTHCEAVYRFLQRNYATTSIYYLYTRGMMEDKLKTYFTDIEKTTASVPLHMHYVMLNEPVNKKQLLINLDSTRQNVFIIGSLNDNFSKNICVQLAPLEKTYPTTIVGMPTWDNIDFTQPEFGGLEVLYSTPFYNNPSDTLIRYIQQDFKSRFFSRPSDMVFRGYETMYRFARMLLQYGNGLSDHITAKTIKVFSDFDIEPVFLNKENTTPDYFENKKLYFIKKADGNITAVY
jgi:hypothetical protein